MWIKKGCSLRGIGSRCCEISVHQITGLLIALSIIVCGGLQSCRKEDPRVRADLILKVTELSRKTKDQEALRAAVKALYAAGSEEEALSLLRKVEEEKDTLLLQVARYAAVRGREKESVEFVRRAFELTSVSQNLEVSAKSFDELIVEASRMAASAESTAILEHLRLLAGNKEISADAASAMIIAVCEIAVASEDWRLLDSASSFVPFLTEDKVKDSAFLTMSWANAYRMTITKDMNYLEQGLAHAEAISDRPKKAQAFALLAEVARKSWNTDLMQKMTKKMDAAMTGTAGSQVVEGFCRIALVFRLKGFARELLKDAIEYARKTLTTREMVDLPDKKSEDKSIGSVFGLLSSSHFSWIAVVALKLDEIGIANIASKEALDLIENADPEMSILLGLPAFTAFLDVIQQLDRAKTQKAGLIAMKQLANRIPEPLVRSLVLAKICETAGEIAIARKSPEFLKVAWQTLVLDPIPKFQETMLIELSYASARLGEPQFVISRFPDLVTAQKPALDLKIYSAALTGLAEMDKILVEKESRFLAETETEVNN